jgi:hypothetical protein
MIHSVSIEMVSPQDVRYRTVGDWFFTRKGCLTIQVADIEVILCEHDGVTEKQVDKFDLTHQDDDDPGTHPKAPYHKQHLIAMGVEMLLAASLGVKWRTYEEALDRIYYKIPKRKKPL